MMLSVSIDHTTGSMHALFARTIRGLHLHLLDLGGDRNHTDAWMTVPQAVDCQNTGVSQHL